MTLTITIGQRPAPDDTAFAATAQTKAIHLKWGVSDIPDTYKMNVYRYTNSSDAAADTSATLVGYSYTREYYDSSNLTIGEDYFYRLAYVDDYFNESAKCDAVSAVYTGIGGGDFDLTPPSAPGTPTVANFTGDIDLDGAIDTGLTVTWTAPGSGVTPNYYVLEVYRSSTVGTSGSLTGYSLWQVIPVLSGLTANIFANANKYHKVVVKGVSVAGVTGTGSSSNSVGIKPQGYSALLSTVAWVTASGTVQPIVAQPKAIQLRWLKVTNTQYKETVVYRHTSNSSGSAVEIGRVAGDRFVDTDGLTSGTTYYYWLKNCDKAGDLSASFSSVQSVAYRVVETDDIGVQAVLPSKVARTDGTNLIQDSEMWDMDLWSTAGTVASKARLFNQYHGSSLYKVRVVGTGTFYLISNADIPVIAGQSYYFEAWFGGSANTSAVTAISTIFQVKWYPLDSSGNLGTLIATDTVASFTDGYTTGASGSITAPANAQVCQLTIGAVSAPSNTSLYVATPIVRRKIRTIDIAPGAVGEAQISSSAKSGTVSESGGVPTGSIIERGSNSNGTYIKWADGTMICTWVDTTGIACSTASGSLFTAASASTWTFPAAFSTTAGTVLSGTSTSTVRWVVFGTLTTTTVTYNNFSPSSSASAVVLRMMAIGRWY